MIGDRIKKRRLEKNMSISQLANKTGIVKSYLSSLERSLQKNPSIQILEKISHVLEIPLDSLLHDKASDSRSSSGSIDDEWLCLVREATNSGITKEQFQAFIDSKSNEKRKRPVERKDG
ncbi:helix-turn-helix domain-containing protein [Peribacillus saganii]|uniref:Helix-turn-helix domain-containing protein n=1 Tax=Peribacillus saganii TaxID=2303992 RepID=A0A372LPM8_9BACI|nr:helix-turn-helix domain-containing protein [Peribacillus saganii]RFU69348.1 helix-turn-helix domain-containing protein [Peribacillus saganii]